MQRTAIMVARTLTTAWAGAAVIFVLTSIREVTNSDFDSVTKSQLVLLRFPIYYTFATVCLTGGIGAAGLALVAHRRYRQRLLFFLGLTVAAAALIIVDYVWIYSPLQQMTSVLDQARPASFHGYHQMSRWINAVDVGLCWIAAGLINWPLPESRRSPEVAIDGVRP